VLDQKMPATVQRCFDSLKPLQAQLAAGVAGGDALNALLLELVAAAHRVRATYVSEVREALAADASAFQLGRFPAFVDAVVSRLAAQTSTGDAELVWRKQELGVLLIEAAAAVPAEGWVEACKAKRLELRARMGLIEPVKAKTLELLKVRTPSHKPSLSSLTPLARGRCPRSRSRTSARSMAPSTLPRCNCRRACAVASRPASRSLRATTAPLSFAVCPSRRR